MTSTVKLAFNRHDPSPGAGEGSVPVIFLHGMTAMKENWGDLPKITAEKTNRTVYAVDARNHGDSPWDDAFDFDVNVDDLLHFLDEHDIPKAVLIGHSMGGVTAYKTALKAPDRVEGIFVEDMTSKPIPQPLFDVIVMYLNLARDAIASVPSDLELKDAKVHVLKQVFEKLPPEIKPLARPNTADEVVNLKKGEDGRWAAKANLDVLQKSAVSSKGITAPLQGRYEGAATVIYGKMSPFQVGDDVEAIQEHFPKAILVCVEEATHTVHSDCPEEFREALFAFLQE